MDFLSNRVKNIFSQMFQPDPSQMDPSQVDPMNQIDSRDANIQALLHQSTDANDRLKELLNSQPTREQFKPSTMTNIMSRLAGLSASGVQGISGGQPIGYKGMGKEGGDIIDSGLNKGYNQAMLDWNAKLKPINDLAINERSQNANNRMMAGILISDENKDAALAQKTKKDETTAQIERDKLAEKREFLAYLDYKSKHPNHVYKSDRNGYVYSIDPQSNNIAYLADSEGNKIRADKLPEAEKLNIEQANKLEAQTHQGTITRENQANQGKVTRENITAQGNKEVDVATKTAPIKKDIKATPPGKAPVTAKYKIGEKKVFPNGKVGVWDGQGFKPTGEVVK